MHFILVGLGGAIGSVLRYGAGLLLIYCGLVERPYLATLGVNLIGSFVLGLLMGLLTQSGRVSHEVRLFVGTGICGGFTTFSALSTEGLLLFQNGRAGEAFLYLIGSLAGGIVAAALGFRLTAS